MQRALSKVFTLVIVATILVALRKQMSYQMRHGSQRRQSSLLLENEHKTKIIMAIVSV